MFSYTIQELGHLNFRLGAAIEQAKQRTVTSEQLALDAVRVLVAKPTVKGVPEKRSFYFRLREAYGYAQSGSEASLHEVQSTAWKYLEKLLERDCHQPCIIAMMRNNLLGLALDDVEARKEARFMAENLDNLLDKQHMKPDEKKLESNIELWLKNISLSRYENQYSPFIRFLQILKDFYRLKHGNWTYRELRSLGQVLKTVKLPWKSTITVSQFMSGLLTELDTLDGAHYLELIDPAFEGETIDTQFIMNNVSSPFYLGLYRIAMGYGTTRELIEELVRKTGMTRGATIQGMLFPFLTNHGLDLNQPYTTEGLAMEILGAQYLASRLFFDFSNAQSGLKRAFDPVVRFLVSSNGQEVTDTHNGLVWRRWAEGLNRLGETASGKSLTFTHEAALEYAAAEAARTGQAWRLPTVEELVSLVDRTQKNPSINPKIFPNTPPKWFWTASPKTGNTHNAWSVGFYYGYVSYVSRGNLMAVRLVKG